MPIKNRVLKGLKNYKIAILIPDGTYDHEYDIDESFFERFEDNKKSGCNFKVRITLDKGPRLIETHILITGKMDLICDRSLHSFEYPIECEEKIIFKYGDKEKELNESLHVITNTTSSIDVSQFIYDLISVQIPLKKLHPRYHGKEDDKDEIVYHSKRENKRQNLNEMVDPRWESLKKLKEKEIKSK